MWYRIQKILRLFYYVVYSVYLKLSINLRLALCRKNFQHQARANDVVASLTSYGKRVDSVVHFAIYSIFMQEIVPEHVVLWLDDSWSSRTLPRQLVTLQKYFGLEVKYCSDMKSYKKLIPALKMYPEHTIITFDDDLYYRRFVVKELLNALKIHGKAIYACAGHMVSFLKDGSVAPYRLWRLYANRTDRVDNNSLTCFLLGGSPALYPPHSLHDDVLDESLFSTLAPHADDIWFFMMALKQNTPKRILPLSCTSYISLDYISQKLHLNRALFHMNVLQGENDKQFQQVFNHYKMHLVKQSSGEVILEKY